MKLTFLGTGPSDPVTKDSRTRSSLYVRGENFSFIIDCSIDFLKQTRREDIKKLDFIIQTHAHRDAMGGLADQLKTWMKENNIEKIPVYVEQGTWEKIKERIANTDHLETRYFTPYAKFNADGKISIAPFRIIHSIQPGFPTVGFRFDDIVYSEDVGKIPEESEKYYKNANLIIFDAAMWFDRFIKGHYNIEMALEEAKKYKPDLFVLTQAGHTYPPQESAEKQIQEYWSKVKEEVKTRIKLAYDGLTLQTQSSTTMNLMKDLKGIYLVKPHGKMIWEGEKTLIVKSVLFKNAIGKDFYLLEGDRAYGIIRIKAPYKINIKEFNDLADKHMVTEEERLKWWPYKQVLFAYPFEKLEMFAVPKKVEVPKGVQTFVKDFKFLQEYELIVDVDKYNPEKMDTNVLKDDWRIVMAWYSSKKEGKSLVHSFETIEKLAKMIYKELKKRGIEFHPDKMKPHALDLFNKIAEEEDKMAEKQKEIDLKSYKLLDDFKDMTIIKDFISIIGSYAEQREGHTPNDIDILVRMARPNDFLRRAVEVRILKTLGWPDNWTEKVHFVWGDSEGPHDTFIPLYDLILKKQSPIKKVEMLDENLKKKWVCPEVYDELNIDFYTMKPAKRFYEVNEALKYMFSVGDKFAIEKKINGFRGVLEKKGDSVKIFSDEKRDISRHFKTIMSQSDDLSSKDIILDGELVLKGAGRAEIAKYVTGKGELDDSDIEFHAFDIMKFDGDVSNKPWNERKSILHGLNFTKNIKEVRSIIVFTPDQARKAINIVKNLPGSEGAMIKTYDGTYSKGKTSHAESSAWIKFRIEDPIDVKIIDVFKKVNGFSYKVGIDVKDQEQKFHSDYLIDGILVLGNTFVTKDKFEKGDYITVNVEEVWRHEYRKENKIRYSIHKPKVIKQAKETSSWKYLDDLAVSKGEEVIENIELKDSEDFFSKWSSDMAYILGYLTSDSYIYREKNRLEITSNDKAFITNIINKIGFVEEINKIEDYYMVKHVSQKIVEDLIDLGFTQYKKDRTTYKGVPEKYASDYIRGVMDADGTLDEERNKLQIDTPNAGLASYLFKHLKKVGGDGVHLYRYAKFMRKIAVTSNTDEVLKWIYKGGKMFLRRKKAIAKEIIGSDETITTTPGVPEVQGVIWWKKKLPIQKQEFSELDPKSMSISELTNRLLNEAKIYNAIKSGEQKGSLEKPLLVGAIIYNELKRRDIEAKLPDEFNEFMDIIKKGKTGIMKEEAPGDDFGETRKEAADKFWDDNWQDMYPKDGKGEFAYQHHWRGLTEEEARKLTEEELLNTDHSLHGDLRFEVDNKRLFGFTTFIGTAEDNKKAGGDKLIYDSKHKGAISRIMGNFKLEIPHSWLYVGKGKSGTVSPPRGVGATEKKWAKFFIVDNGTYELGVCRKHFREIFFNGKELKGRMTMAYAPLREGRKWLLDFPADQKPYADTHKIEDVIKELRQKKQKWLIWAKPGIKPKRIDVEKWQEEEKQGK